MKERPIFPLLVSMALPMVLSMTVNALYNIVDSFFVAQISEQAMTALSLVYPVQNMINAIAIGFGVGINALIALYSGAGDRCRADTAATHGLVFSILHGLIAAVVCIAIMPGFLRLFTGDEAVIALGVRYSSIAFFFAPVVMAELCFEKLFQAIGRMNETMAALLCGSITNIILDPVLIFGLGPFPMLGISGAALATGIGQCVTLSVYLIIYCTHRFPVQLRLSCIKPDWRLDAKLYSIGVPAILNLALPSVLVSFLNSLLAAYSQGYVVILGIYYKLQTFLYLPAGGIVQGMRPLISYNYGAGEHGRRHHHLPDGQPRFDRHVHHQRRYHRRRSGCFAHHQRGLPGIHPLGHGLRLAGSTGQGHPVPHHLAVPLHHHHDPRCVDSLPPVRTCRRVARFLGHRASQRPRRRSRLQAHRQTQRLIPPGPTPGSFICHSPRLIQLLTPTS